MDFFHSTDLSEFFKPEDILEVVTDLKDTPFTGHFVSHNYEFICLCDAEGNKSVVPTSNVKYITSHKGTAPIAPIAEGTQMQSADSADVKPANDADQAFTPKVIKATSKWNDEFQEGVEGSLRDVSVKVVDKIDLDNHTRPSQRKKTYGQYGYSAEREPRKFSDPLDNLYLEAMGTVKRTGQPFCIITTNEGEDLKCMNFHALDHLYVGDKVIFSTYWYTSRYDVKETLQACNVVKVSSVGKLLSKMSELKYERNGKEAIANLTAILKKRYSDNDDVMDAIRDNGFDQYYTRDHKRPRIQEQAETGGNTDESGYYIPLAERMAKAAEEEADSPAAPEETPAAPEETPAAAEETPTAAEATAESIRQTDSEVTPEVYAEENPADYTDDNIKETAE